MIKRMAIVENGIVTNVVLVDTTSDWKTRVGEAIEHDHAGIGWEYTGNEFIEPPPDGE